MIEQKLRPFFQRFFVDSLASKLSNVNPNYITIASLLVGLVSAIFIFINEYFAIFFLLLSGYLDILDGSVSRINNSSTPFGSMLDIISDRMVESFIIIAIFARNYDIAIMGVLMMSAILICVSSFLLVGIFSNQDDKKSFYYSPGLIERAESFIFFIAFILVDNNYFIVISSVVYIALVVWTSFYRMYEFQQQTK